jgi:cell division protein FtsI (penicillin-binding protein 3)
MAFHVMTPPTGKSIAIKNVALMSGVMLAFGVVAAQLINLGLSSRDQMTLAVSEPLATSFSRPDIIDRNGRLLATDVEAPSVFADPAVVLDRDEMVEELVTVFPDLEQADLRRALSDKTRRFIWIRRGVSPKVAQRVHDLGLPGLSFRNELRRAYPGGETAGHILGSVNVDNKGMGGIEKYIDDTIGVDAVHGATLSAKAPVRLSLDIGVQHALEDELDTATRRYHTEGAAGLVLDIRTGEILASASLPRIDPGRPSANLDAAHQDRVAGGTYELGSVFKTMTLAMAFDEGIADVSRVLDVRVPLVAGRHTITDFHPAGRPLSVTEVFTHSSNVGAGMLALEAGPERVQAFLRRVGLLDPIHTEAGAVAPPQLPERWGQAELITTSYGHGIAVAPLQFAAAAATLLNGGERVTPTLLHNRSSGTPAVKGVVTRETSRQIARLFRLNVIDADGTGRRADVPGYRVGGKTGTADRAEGGGYEAKAVISSFLGAFPMDDPQYLTFVMLFEPKGTEETGGQRTASTNAAPVTARLIGRIAANLGVVPLTTVQTQ